MKLVIQIPCYNEGETLAGVLSDLPGQIDGFDAVEVLVIDDGSTDATAQIARDGGAHVVTHGRNRGLAEAFLTGLDAACRMGADVIVNTDGDRQYPADAIHQLVAPVIRGQAEMVIGDRQPERDPRTPATKRWLYRLGAMTVRTITGRRVNDATSGFRAMSRDFALRAYLLSSFSYTLETIFHAADQRARIVEIPIEARAPTRPSRLHRGNAQYVRSSAGILLRGFAMQRPMSVFTLLSTPFLFVGSAFILRFLYIFFSHAPDRTGHIQSLVLAAACIVVGVQILAFGMVGELIRTNRLLIQDLRTRVRELSPPEDPTST